VRRKCAGSAPKARERFRLRGVTSTVVGVPRLPRPQIPDGIYHVNTRGIRSLPIFLDVDDRETFLATLGVVVARFEWTLLEYVEMTSHYHLLVQTPQPNIAAGMQMLNGSYAWTFNRRHAFGGHLFDRRYGATFVQSVEQLWSTVRYIAFNPVDAGLCADPAEWPHGSVPATLGLCAAREFVDVQSLYVLLGVGTPEEFAAGLYERRPLGSRRAA
jgi:REP element-mobilizing transposase RayT